MNSGKSRKNLFGKMKTKYKQIDNAGISAGILIFILAFWIIL